MFRDTKRLKAIFFRASSHMLTFRKRSVVKRNGREICLLHHPDGNRCPVGLFIPDSAYRPTLEDHPLTSRPVLTALAPTFGPLDPAGPEVRLLSRLQTIHDANQPERWAQLLFHLAIIQDLPWPYPQPEA